ncbi:hypothetical protein [Leptolyngbya sp. NIES-2104]|uniref:hypothetical protein n=1 Tax=Leptolyngbya sp. NIES-2104 TaxID=1552121 RepID=UPI00073ED40E|nr:hypothetical protein [Leptolyngbya sp. NIES-2104]
MSGLLEILEKIRHRPGMYLGAPSVSNLFMFLNGYEIARSELNIELTKEEAAFHEEFQPWLQKKFGTSSSASWAKLIMLRCSDEAAGLQYFFQLLDEFQQQSQAIANQAVEV